MENPCLRRLRQFVTFSIIVFTVIITALSYFLGYQAFGSVCRMNTGTGYRDRRLDPDRFTDLRHHCRQDYFLLYFACLFTDNTVRDRFFLALTHIVGLGAVCFGFCMVDMTWKHVGVHSWLYPAVHSSISNLKLLPG